MADPLATLAELKKHWSALPSDREEEATQKLLEASIEIRGNFPDVDDRLEAGTLDHDTVALVTNRMVKRAMDPLTEERQGISQATATTGPFTQALSFTNPDGNLYLSKADRRLLTPAKSNRKAFSVHPGLRRA